MLLPLQAQQAAVNTLPGAVGVMGRLQLGKKFIPQEDAQIVALLKALTGDPLNFGPPILSQSSDATPRPNLFK